MGGGRSVVRDVVLLSGDRGGGGGGDTHQVKISFDSGSAAGFWALVS